MPTKHRVAVVVGSLRRESWSRKVAHALADVAPATLVLKIVEIGALPLYNQDDEADAPKPWSIFRQQIRSADGVLFVTPEYNRSVPGVLKNAIDVGSRPYGQSAWAGKPGGVVSCSPGALAGFGANHHLRQSLVYLGVPTLQQPEAYVGNVATLFDAEGRLANDATRDFLRTFVEAYGAWVDLNLSCDHCTSRDSAW